MRMSRNGFGSLFALLLVAVVGLAPQPTAAQNDVFQTDLFGSKPPANDAKNAIKYEAKIVPADAAAGDEVTLQLTATVAEGWHTFSLTQTGFGGSPTVIALDDHGPLKPLGKTFTASRAPQIHEEKLGDTQMRLEEYFGQITFSRRFQIPADASLGEVTVSGQITHQVCSEGLCVPGKTAFQATVKIGEGKPKGNLAGTGETKFEHDSSVWLVSLSSGEAAPGETVELRVEANIKDDWHTYGLDQTRPEGLGPYATALQIQKYGELKLDGDWAIEPAPHAANEPLFDGLEVLEHSGHVVWTRSITVPADAASGDYPIGGEVAFQSCTGVKCVSPVAFTFEGHLTVTPTPVVSPLVFSVSEPIKGGMAAGFIEEVMAQRAAMRLERQANGGDANYTVIGEENSEYGLAMYLVFAFIGGMILNVMPCVLPVIAIKVMSFAQQAGESRGRILQLNVVYSLGVLAVFMVLATLAVFLGYGWGGLFQNANFNLIMACVVFAMGLSLLGVFEIPMPGMVGTAAGNQHQEGLVGAFSTGILATLLATPCSGPFLGATLGWSITQPTLIVYLVWGMMGLGMAFPYLMIGMFPSTVKWLPKPGNWMVRLKEFAGFVLMGTVIFIVHILQDDYTIPALIMLLGIALGLWMIGNLYDINSHIRHKTTVRVSAVVLTAVICLFGFNLTLKSETELPWKPFTEAKLNASLAENKTVLVDFSADWCLTCKRNEKFALNTQKTLDLVKDHDVVTLYADYTAESEEIKRWLDNFESISVPLTVIFPAGQPDKAIVLRDLYTEAMLLENLEKAVSGKKTTASAVAVDEVRR